jgi:hypothetical protein
MDFPHKAERDAVIRQQREEAASFNRVIRRFGRSLSEQHRLPSDIVSSIKGMALHVSPDAWQYPKPPIFHNAAQYQRFRTDNPDSEVILMDVNKTRQAENILLAIFWGADHCIAKDLDLSYHDVFYHSRATHDHRRYATTIVYIGDYIHFDFQNGVDSVVCVADILTRGRVVVEHDNAHGRLGPLRFELYKP